MRNLHPIRTESDYEQAIKEIAGYFEIVPEPGTPEGDRFDQLAALIEAYEDEFYPISGAVTERPLQE